MKYHQQKSRSNKKTSLRNENKSFTVQNILFCQGQINNSQSNHSSLNAHKFRPIIIRTSNQLGLPKPKSNVIVLIAPSSKQISSLSPVKVQAQSQIQNDQRFEFFTNEELQKNYIFSSDPHSNINLDIKFTENPSTIRPLEKPKHQKDQRRSNSIGVVQKAKKEQIIVNQKVPSLVFQQQNQENLSFQVEYEPLIKNAPSQPELNSSENKVQYDHSDEMQKVLEKSERKQKYGSEASHELSEPQPKLKVAENQNYPEHQFNHVKSIRKQQPKEKSKQTTSKGRLLSSYKSSSYVPEPPQYTCHCNTRGCKDHYCGCYRRGQKCSTSCLCSDCINIANYKSVKKKPNVLRDERIELIGEGDGDLEFGIQFEPVCFMGFANDLLAGREVADGPIANELPATQLEQRHQLTQSLVQAIIDQQFGSLDEQLMNPLLQN